MSAIWDLLKHTAANFVDDKALSHGAAIAYYTVFAIPPLLLIVIAVAGIIFGPTAAEGAIVGQLGDVLGPDAARGLQAVIASVDNRGASIVATVLGLGTLCLAATSVFVEMQVALNAIWKLETRHPSITHFIRARATSFGLVMAVGFLLLVSLLVNTALAALDRYIDRYLPIGHLIVQGANFVMSFALVTLLFGAIYKVLPDKHIAWSDVLIGAVVTALLFTVGKALISFYLGSSYVAHVYGAAGGLVVTLLWIYYSAQIFLFGAAFTRAFAERHGTHAPGAAGQAPSRTISS